MFHFFEAIQNTKGDALIGYYVKAVDRDTGDVIDIYADNNATPIVSVSAVDNACLVDSDGDASFYVTAGTYHVDIYATDAVTFIRRVNDWPMTLDIDAVLSGTNTGDQTITLTGDVTGSGTGSFAATIAANAVGFSKVVAASGAGIVAASGAGNYAETAPTAARTILDVPSNAEMTAAIAAVGTGGGGADQPLSQVIAGLGIAWTGSLNFTMSAGSYYINGTVYTAAEQSITLSAADGSNDRIDVLAVDTTGTLVKVNGTAAANPSQPDVDPATQLFLKFVIVPAGATAPVISADEIVFEENDGVGEWTGAVLSGTSVVINSTSEPDSGTVCIAATSAGSSAAGVIRLNKGSTISVDTLDSLVIRFKSKTATWGTGQVRIHLQNASGVRVGAVLSIKNGSYGLTTSNTSTYQTLTIPITAFAIPAGTNLQYLQIADNTGAAISWRMDNIKLKKSSTATGGTSNGITQTQGDARYAQRANNLSDIVSASTARTNLGLGTVATLTSDTDGTLAANSDTRVATQKAVKTYVGSHSTSAGGSDRQIQYNNSTAFGGADGADIDADGHIRLDHAASITAPGADQVTAVPQRIAASSGFVLPRWKQQDGTFSTMQGHIGRNQAMLAQAFGNNTTNPVERGLTPLLNRGGLATRTCATGSRLTRSRRVGFVSSASAGFDAGLYGTGADKQWTVGDGSGQGGFLWIFQFGPSDASPVAGAHAFTGLRSNNSAPSITTAPDTLTNVIGVGQVNGSTNWKMCYGGSAAQTAIDTGIAVSNTHLCELMLYSRPDLSNAVSYKFSDLDAGTSTDGVLTGTAGTAIPASSTFLGPLMWRSNNATAASVGIDIISYYAENPL